MKHIKTFESFLNEGESSFGAGELVRFSNPRNSTGMPALYAVVDKDRGMKVDLLVLGTSAHTDFQPTKRNANWSGGSQVDWEGGWSKEELADIAAKSKISVAPGYDKKYLTAWIPA